MNKLYHIIKLILFGRSAVAGKLSTHRDNMMILHGYECDVTGKIKRDNEWHHLWNVKTFPFFAFEDWNGVVLTEKEHKRFHSWRGGTKKWCSPFHYYYWKTLVRK